MMNLEQLIKLIDQNEKATIQDLVAAYRPIDLAEDLEKLDKDRQLLFITLLSSASAAEVIEQLMPLHQYSILHRLSSKQAAAILTEMSGDVVADMMLAIHRHQAENMLKLLPNEYRIKVELLMTFPEDTAGSLATVEYISAREKWTAEQTLKHIRKVGRSAQFTSYVYVVDAMGVLLGVVSLKNIIMTHPTTQLEEIIAPAVSVPAWMEQEETAELLSRYDFVAVPVVDKQLRLIGIVTVDDVIDVMREEATEDMHKLGGSEPLEKSYFQTSTFQLYRKRIVWLLILFVAEAYTGNVMRHYEETLSEVIALSFFIPLLIGTGGNTGTQTVATLVRALAMGEVQFKQIFKVVRKELTTGLLTGVSIAIIAFARAWILGVEYHVGLVVGITALAIVIWASLVAAVLPLLLHKLKADPAVISGPFITTLVDGTGLVIYFTVARLILQL